MIGQARRLAGLTAALLLAAPAWAQDYETARAVAAAAQQAATSNQWAAAERQLIGGRAACGEAVAGRPCRLLLDFNLGSLHQQHSLSEVERREELLDASVTAYRRVLVEAPGHSATLNNLALVLSNLGRIEALRDLLTQARRTAPDQAVAITMLIGEAYRAASRMQEAYDAYAQAARLAPRDEAPRIRMVQAYDASPADGTEQFLGALHSWEQSFPAVTQEGYRAVVRRRHADGPDQAQQALLRWVALAATRRVISAAMAEETFAGIVFRPVRELTAFLSRLEREGPERFRDLREIESAVYGGPPDRDFDYWIRRNERRHSLGLAALALGRASVVAQEPEQAQRQWILGLQYGPRIEEYVIGGMSEETFVPLELITELAWLQFRYPELDPTGRKFKLFIDLLFKGKAEAYRARDLRAIQRHHTVLGEIFAAKGVWQSNWADNGIFQLSHAIDVAERRQQEEGLYQPLPGLKARLAEGYDIVGKPTLALITAIDAAQAYLDSDQLDRAAAMLERARPTAAPAKERTRISALQEILAFRRAIGSAFLAAGEGRKTDDVLTAERIERGIRGLLGLPADFLVRQQFKIDADLAELGLKVPGLVIPKDRADTALFWARKISTLVGMGDVLRLERVATMAAADDDKTGRLAVELLSGPAPSGETVDAWLLASPSGGRSIYATITSGVTAESPRAGPWLVFFGYDSAALSPEAHRLLTRVADTASAAGSAATFRLVGRSDTKGDPAYNLALSERRASSVAAYLVRLGIARHRIETQAVGESHTAIPTDDETPLPGNRVVEIRLD